MEHNVSAASVDDPAVLRWSLPASAAGADFVATMRAPGDALLHVLVADGDGEPGYPSPLLAPFQRMTEKGYGIEAIARELNVIVRREPGRRFVAATLVAVDLGEGFVRVWNGGRPAPILVGATGQVASDGDGAPVSRTFARSHAPLGVRTDADMDDTVDIHAFADGSQLFLCSEGLIEVQSAEGARFGHARFVRTLEQAAADRRFQDLQEAVSGYLGGRAAAETVAALRVECRRLAAPESAASIAATPNDAAVGVWRASLRISAQEIRRVDAVPALLGLASGFVDTKDSAGKLFVVLSELYNNAVDHGLLQLDSGLKLHPDGMEAYLTERQSRLAALTEGEIVVELEQLVSADGNWLRIVCKDSGPGFEHSSMRAAAETSAEVPFGRGLMLLRAMCPVFGFNTVGNEATAVLPLDAVSDA